MKKLLLIPFALALGITPLLAQEQESPEVDFSPERTLSNPDKTSSFEATVKKYDGKKVTFVRKGQSATITVDVEKFSDEDKAWLDENKEEINAKKIDEKDLDGLAKEVAPVVRKITDKGELKKTTEFKTKAKYYIVLYSASWCPPCRNEMPNVVKIYNEKIAKDPKIELIHASCDNDKKAAAEWATTNSAPFPIIYKSDIKKSKIIAENSPPGIPTAVLIEAKTGKVIEKGLPTGLYQKYKSL